MALQELTFPLRFAGGIDTKTDPKSVDPARLIVLENCVFDVSTVLVKRNGYDALPRTVDGSLVYQSPKALAVRGEELVLFADDQAYSFRESSDTWNLIGRAQSIVHSEKPVSITGTDQSMADGATCSGITVLAWEDSRGGVWWSIIEADGGRVLRPAEVMSSGGQKPRVVCVGPRIHVYFADAGGGRLWVAVIDPSSYLSTPTPTILTTTLSTVNPSYDAQRLDAVFGNGSCIVWVLSTGGYQVAFVDPSGVLGSPVTGWPTSISYPADVVTGPIVITSSDASTPFLAVVYGSTLSARIRILNASNLASTIRETLIITTAANPVRVAVVAGVPRGSIRGGTFTDIWAWAEEPNTASLNDRDNRTYVAHLNDDPTAAPFQSLPTRGHGLASRAFRDDAGVYVMLAHEVLFFPYVALVRAVVDNPATSLVPRMFCVGRLIVGTSDGLPERNHCATVETDETNTRLHRWIGISREQVDASPAGQQFGETGLRQVSLNFAYLDAFQYAQFSRDLIIAGAVPLRYDGDTIAELGFHTAPDGSIPATPGTGGALTPSTSYLYTINYEEIDAQGLIHPGPMSIGILVALGAGQNRVTLTIPTYRLTSKRMVRIGVYRSESNDTSGDPSLFRVSSLDPSATTGSNRYIANDTTVDVITFVDDMSDAILLTRERAYTKAGVLSNDPIGLGSLVVGGKDRLFFNDPVDPNIVRYTQAARDGYGPEVAADLSFRVDKVGGDIGAYAIMDDALFIFEERAVLFVAGPGPLANPDAAPQIGFSPPQQLPTEYGCTSPRSIATASDRIFYQAANNRGIKQIDRSRSFTDVGAPVEAFNSQRIVSADPIPGTERVIFLTNAGKTLLYDHYHGQWSTYTNHEGIDAVLVEGTYFYLRSNPVDLRVFRQATHYLDAGVAIRRYLETAWIKMANYHQGLQRIWYALILGQYRSPHRLEFACQVDYHPGWLEPYVIDVDADYNPSNYGVGPYGAGPFGGSSDAVYQQRVHVGLKCEAIRFMIADSVTPPPQGASFDLSELLLTGGIMRPSMTFGAGRTQ